MFCRSMASSGHYSVSLDSEFQSRKKDIGSNIQKILGNVRSMNRMISKIGTELENAQIQSQLHQITHNTGQLAKDTCKLLKALNGLETGPENQRQWKLDREDLQEEFTNALNQYQDAQRQAAKKEKELVKKLRFTHFMSKCWQPHYGLHFAFIFACEVRLTRSYYSLKTISS